MDSIKGSEHKKSVRAKDSQAIYIYIQIKSWIICRKQLLLFTSIGCSPKKVSRRTRRKKTAELGDINRGKYYLTKRSGGAAHTLLLIKLSDVVMNVTLCALCRPD